MQKKDKVDPQTIEQLQTASKKYDEAINNNDAAAVAALFTEDAVFVTDTGPVYGRKAIEKAHVEFFQQWHCSNHTAVADQFSPHVIGTSGQEIWWNGEWSQTLQGKGGDPIQVKGYWSAIKVREGDSWKDRMMTWNVTPAPPSEAK
jgi:ketosteroid isomerase-like protein